MVFLITVREEIGIRTAGEWKEREVKLQKRICACPPVAALIQRVIKSEEVEIQGKESERNRMALF